MRPARCDRSRESISLRLDETLSTVERKLLDRHLRSCASCRAFAADAERETELLRTATLERPHHAIEIAGHRARFGRGVAGLFTAAAAAALLVLTAPGARDPARHAVPPLRVERATLVDGPVHGLFRLPA